MSRIGSILIFYFLIPQFTFANIEITEIMYDLSGSDSKREWIEVYNSGNESINLSDWRFFDGANHKLNAPPENDSQGSIVLLPSTYAILASNAGVYLSERNGVGTVLDTVMSLNNTLDTLMMIDEEGVVRETVSYENSLGAAGDGNSLQVIGGVWRAGLPTPLEDNTHEAIEIVVDDETNGDGDEESTEANEKVETFVFDPYVDPDIRGNAGGDRVAVSGERLVFKGEAFGSQNKSLVNVRYLWNVGNGLVLEGEQVAHTFVYPGKSVVVLTVASGKKTVSDRLYVTTSPADIVIVSVDESGVTLLNNEEIEVDLSRWMLKNGSHEFVFPNGTFIFPKEKTYFASSDTKVAVSYGESVSVRYPNGVEFASTTREVDAVEVRDSAVVPSIEDATDPAPSEAVTALPERTVEVQRAEQAPLSKKLDPEPEELELQKKSIVEFTPALAIESVPTKPSTSLYSWLLGLLGIVSLASLSVIGRTSLLNPKSAEEDAQNTDDYKLL